MLSAAAAAVGEDYVGGPIDPPSPISAIGVAAARAPLKRSELKLSPKSRSFSPMC